MNGRINVKAAEPLLRFSYRYVMTFTIAAQAVSLLAAYILGVSYHYNKLTRTHCINVPNFWPSISKVTGDHLPERYVWRLAIALISFPRIMDGILYHKFFTIRSHYKWWCRWLNRLNSFLMMVQLFLFYTCVYISSNERMDIHLYGWVVFLLFSLAHMVTFLTLYCCGGHTPLTRKERVSLKLRGVFLAVHLVAIILFLYYGDKHLFYCQPYAYSIAAMCECVVAASNLAFHAVQLLDFGSLQLNYHMQAYKQP